MLDTLNYLLTILGSIVLIMTAHRAFVFAMRREWGAAITTVVGGAVVLTLVFAQEQITNWLSPDIDTSAGSADPSPAPEPSSTPPRSATGSPTVDVPWDTVATGALIALAAGSAFGLGAGARYLLRRRSAARQRRAELEQRHDAVRDAYAGFAADILAVLDRPALADVTVPETERLIHALDAARDARTYADADYRAAVAELEIAWTAADRTARKHGTSQLPDAERRAVEQARLLLATALDETGNSNERHLAYRRAMRLIKDIVDVPVAAVAALTESTRLTLPASK